MRQVIRKNRRFFALGTLLAFALAWVLPVQACLATAPAATAVTPMPCLCPQPCDPAFCGVPVIAQCAAAMVPMAVGTSHFLDRALPAPLLLDSFVASSQNSEPSTCFIPDTPLPRPSISVNIRFCTFQN
jgi:hypothetical protein